KDAPEKKTSLGEILWSEPSSWLMFMEAAHLMQLTDDATLRTIMDNLDRSHGAHIGNQYGFDVSLAHREQAIFPDVTAQALQVARLIHHDEAVKALNYGLNRYEQSNGLVSQVVGVDVNKADVQTGWASGQISRIYPQINGQAWALSPKATAAMLEAKNDNGIYNQSTHNTTPVQSNKAQITLDHSGSNTIWYVLALLGIYLIVPLINILRGKIVKSNLFIKSKANVTKTNVAQAKILIQKSIVITQPSKDGRVILFDKDSLDVVAANGLVGFIAYVKSQHQDLKDEELKQIVREWSYIFYNEFILQKTHFSKVLPQHVQEKINRYMAAGEERKALKLIGTWWTIGRFRSFRRIRGFRPEKGVIAKSKISSIGAVKGTILDPKNKNGIWEPYSFTKVRLKPNTKLSEEDVEKIVINKKDSEKVWKILQRALEQEGNFYTDPRYHPHTFINDYFWGMIDQMRQGKLSVEDGIESLKNKEKEYKVIKNIYEESTKKLFGTPKPGAMESNDILAERARAINNEEISPIFDKYKKFAREHMNEVVNPVLINWARFLPIVLSIFAGVFIRSEIAS
ncbi:MAG: hypothetical protein WCH62_09235, partial [Candidatus Omnitrophota bacterium]